MRRPAAASGTDTLPAARGIQGGPADLLIGDGLHAMILRVLLFLYFCRCAYTIRLHAIEEYGLVIHEFDPWFNYRATEYLAQHGYEKFFKWYDYMSWYPLGRPVGTTIYPGMQLTSVAIWNVLNGLGIEISLNDVCCYVPAWFGVLATIFLTMLTYECSGSANGAVAAAGIMAVVPAHIMRSVGGGYDNESVAMTAMCCTFYFWCRSLRGDASWPIGIVAGIAYIYMAAAWGGYIFVVNMIGVHAIGLVFFGRYSNKLHVQPVSAAVRAQHSLLMSTAGLLAWCCWVACCEAHPPCGYCVLILSLGLSSRNLSPAYCRSWLAASRPALR